MVYNVIGLMSGSSLDGLDIAFVELQESAGKWTYNIIHAECDKYAEELMNQLKNAQQLSALNYQLLHASYGHYIGSRVNNFIEKNNFYHKVHLIASHGHTVFHLPQKLMTSQLGDGSAIAAETKLPVVSDLRSLDVALGGEGAPIVPIGEQLLFNDFDFFLNIGGIANISFAKNKNGYEKEFIAFDVCAANRILNMLAVKKNLSFDEDGKIASSGKLNSALLKKLNSLDYYKRPYPKSLDNSFGIQVIYPIIESFSLSVEDAMHTYAEHIILQIKNAVLGLGLPPDNAKLLATGGGALNKYLVQRLINELSLQGITLVIPEEKIINYKEALIMALIGTLRWREEYTTLNSVTGASGNSIGGALWLGTDA